MDVRLFLYCFSNYIRMRGKLWQEGEVNEENRESDGWDTKRPRLPLTPSFTSQDN